MAWDKDESGAILMDGEHPVWVSETGEKRAVDYPALQKRLSEVNAESKQRKDKIRDMEEKYAPVANIEDLNAFLEKAHKAIEMMEAAPDRDKDIEEQVRKRLDAATDPLKSQIAAKDKIIAERDKALAETRARFHRVTIQTDVLNSKLLNERFRPEDRVFLQRELMRAGSVTDDGKVVFHADNGELIYGESGDTATADEAALHILKALGIDPASKLLSQSNVSGSGASSGSHHPGGEPNPFAQESWNVTRQMQIAVTNPAEAVRLQQAAQAQRLKAGR